MLMMADKSFHNSNFPFKVQTALFPPILSVVFLEMAGLLAKYWSTKTIFCLLVVLFFKFFYFLNFILFLNFTILYWFCQISKWIHHRYTCVPHPEPSSLLPPHTIPLGRPSAPVPSIQYRASNLDWRLVVLSNKIGALCKRYENVSLQVKQ